MIRALFLATGLAALAALVLLVAACGGPATETRFAICNEDGETQYIPADALDSLVQDNRLGPCHKSEPDAHYDVPVDEPW